MAKLTAWLVTILGIILVFAALGFFNITDSIIMWALAIGVLVIGIGKLMRNYNSGKSSKKR